MLYVRTKSGRYMAVSRITGFAIEDQFVEENGKRMRVYNVIAYLPDDLNPAILAIYRDMKTAQENLEKLVKNIIESEKGIVQIESRF